MASNAQKRAEKAKQAKLEEDPDYVAPVAETDTKKIVEDAIKSIKKDGLTFSRMKDKSKELRSVLPTGIFGLDHLVLGSGGFPQGRIVEVFGAPSGGKGTLMAQLVGYTQKTLPDAEIAYIDAECAFDHSYAAGLGVDTDNLLIAEPAYGEEALQAALDIIKTGGIKLAVIDSVAALVPKAELDGVMADAHVGLQARMLGQALRKLNGEVSKTKTCLIFINQTRAKIGVSFGDPSDTPGGKALKFYSSVRLQIDRIQQIKVGDENVGNVTKIRAQKNKTAIPFREMNFNLVFGQGFDGTMSLVELAIKNNVWKQSGPMYTLASTGEAVKGKNALRDALDENKELNRITAEATLVAMGKQPDYIKRSLA